MTSKTVGTQPGHAAFSNDCRRILSDINASPCFVWQRTCKMVASQKQWKFLRCAFAGQQACSLDSWHWSPNPISNQLIFWSAMSLYNNTFNTGGVMIKHVKWSCKIPEIYLMITSNCFWVLDSGHPVTNFCILFHQQNSWASIQKHFTVQSYIAFPKVLARSQRSLPWSRTTYIASINWVEGDVMAHQAKPRVNMTSQQCPILNIAHQILTYIDVSLTR